MDRMTPEQMIEVIQGYIDGKQIQYNDYGEWRDNKNMPLFNFYDTVYRVKPEPREWYAVVDKNDVIQLTSKDGIGCVGSATSPTTNRIIKVREVIE